MPMFTYRCHKCETVVEAMRSVAERDDGPKCEACDNPMPITRQLVAPGFILKGENWHNTVYNKTRRRNGQ